MDDYVKTLAKEMKQDFMDSANELRSMFGLETDAEIRRYESLNQRDFATAVNVFGHEKVFDYIREMEARRLRRRVK